MGRRQFSREFRLEVVRLIKERGVSVAQGHPSYTTYWDTRSTGASAHRWASADIGE